MTYKVIDTVEQYEELLAITDLEKSLRYYAALVSSKIKRSTVTTNKNRDLLDNQ
ncbi:hypothetical protein [Caldibacillus thermoamylovorans]|uniref:hypothetical protein n=1 Tax=Caldibacillus thermoamylovorans TaxID=35841 RepID=UPI0022E3E406|nr:hypothetical protein [Caldibacillus thermoamylovorans]